MFIEPSSGIYPSFDAQGGFWIDLVVWPLLPINSELFDKMFWENVLDSIHNKTTDNRQELVVGRGIVRKLMRIARYDLPCMHVRFHRLPRTRKCLREQNLSTSLRPEYLHT